MTDLAHEYAQHTAAAMERLRNDQRFHATLSPAEVQRVEDAMRAAFDAIRSLELRYSEPTPTELAWIRSQPEVAALIDLVEHGAWLGETRYLPGCGCRACRDVREQSARERLFRPFVACPDCGNKRCPKATDHSHACTGSNEPGQPGSAYTGHLGLCGDAPADVCASTHPLAELP